MRSAVSSFVLLGSVCRSIDLCFNNLVGEFPPCIGTFTKLRYDVLSLLPQLLAFTTVVCRELRLSGNRISGELPEHAVANIAKLTKIV